MIMKHPSDSKNEFPIDSTAILPTPSLREGKIVIGKPVTVFFDLTKLEISSPYHIDFSFRNEKNAGPDAGRAPYLPGKAIEKEVELVSFFQSGEKVKVRANLYYWVNGAGSEPIVSETSFSELYTVV
jgi:hypothetical protein